MTQSTYYLDSLIPSWLAADRAYRQALGDHLLDRLAHQGYQPVARVAFDDAPSEVPVPVGMILLRAAVTVQEFDVEMDDA